MAVIMRGEAAPAQIAGLLIGLSMKGERPSELVGFARTMRAEAVPLARPPGEVFDTCGTGGDRSGTFNISTAAALVLAGVRCAGGQARQSVGVEQMRQRGRARSARRRHRGAAGRRSRSVWQEVGGRVLLRADISSRPCVTPARRGATSACARRSTSLDR